MAEFVLFLFATVALVFFAVVAVGNASCLFMTSKSGKYHSTIPLVGAASGVAGLLVLWPIWNIFGFLRRGCVFLIDMRNRHLKRGVTLIEMMVVVTIIALFTGVVGVKYMTHVERSKEVAAKTQLNAFNLAIAAYYADVARYPTADEGLAALRQSTSKTWRGPYLIDELPKDPWGRPYIYEITVSGEPRVICLGADGAPGGDAANADVFSWK